MTTMSNSNDRIHNYNFMGPYYSVDTAVRLTGSSPDGINGMIKNNQILSVITSDKTLLFPAWQFDNNGAINNNLAEIFKIMLPYGDGWTVLAWLCTLDILGNNRMAVDILMNGSVDDRDRIINIAREDVEGWKY